MNEQKEKSIHVPLRHEIRVNGEKSQGIREISPYTRGLAIKIMCTECLGYEGDPQKHCTSPTCPLFPFRRLTRAGFKSTRGAVLGGEEGAAPQEATQG